MAEGRSATPEKELLRLIEDPKTKSSNRAQAHAVKHFGLSLFSPGAWMGRLSFFKDRFKKRAAQDKSQLFDIRLINNMLFAAIVLLTFYLLSNFYASYINLKKLPSLELMASGKVKLISAGEGAVLKKTVAYYLEKISIRDIFKMGAKSAAPGGTKGPSTKIIEATQNLKLVGISWSDNPDAMIEDTKALKTFFVKRGNVIGNAKVEAIFKDKVVLSYAGEEIELK